MNHMEIVGVIHLSLLGTRYTYIHTYILDIRCALLQWLSLFAMIQASQVTHTRRSRLGRMGKSNVSRYLNTPLCQAGELGGAPPPGDAAQRGGRGGVRPPLPH